MLVDNRRTIREIAPGMGQAVAERTILRKDYGNWEKWVDVADRVAVGNCALSTVSAQEAEELFWHIAKGNTLMSGRHLQHGDRTQPERGMEVFTNCSTSVTSFLQFYLLLNGSGVGRCYDDDLMLINWDNAPNLRCVLSQDHPDFDYSAHESVRDAKHKYGHEKDTKWFTVPDTREGWAKALELWENAAFEKIHKDKLLILDFSEVREKGRAIGGMQARPASGPVALMNAFQKAASLKGAGLRPWKQAMYVDHYFAECVLVAGARRASRMSTKSWRDPDIFDFITLKRPIEYQGKNIDEIIEYRKTHKPLNFLWSSNNSVTVDEEFWDLISSKYNSDMLARQANIVFEAVCQCSYGDGTGEPGFINSHKLTQNDEGWTDLNRGDYVGSAKYQLNEDTQLLMSRLAKKAKKKKWHTICNPCGEIALNVLGGFCVIADLVPFHCDTIYEFEDCARAVTRALIRVNTMDSVYKKEVQRTNRIGVSLTGIHEFAWKQYGFDFYDLINEEISQPFWNDLARVSRAVYAEAVSYSKELNLPTPHTATTIKPAGTTSKLFRLTEGAHLPSMEALLRWVQFRSDDPLVQKYKEAGYPVRELVQYQGTAIVGFPTAGVITDLGMGKQLTTAGNASPESQYKWLMLLEKYWLNGNQTVNEYANQISYTLKYDPAKISYEEFRAMLLKYQPLIKCCTVMPQSDISAHEYQPEQAITHAEYQALVAAIDKQKALKEEVAREHIGCENGACPVEFNEGAK